MIGSSRATPLVPLLAAAVLARRPLRRAAVGLAVDATTWGLEEVAESARPIVFAANHPSALDAPLLRSVLEPVIGPVVVLPGAGRAAGPRADAAVVRAATIALRAGRSVVVFAETERSDDGDLRRFGDTAARIALAADAPLVPVALSGTFAALPPWRPVPRVGRPSVTVTFGRPILPGANTEPAALALHAEGAVATAVEGARGSWFAAHRAHAASGSSDGTDSGATTARWRRIWDSTQNTRSARRRTWR